MSEDKPKGSGLEQVEILQLGTAVRNLAMIYCTVDRLRYPVNCGYDRGMNDILTQDEADIIKEAVNSAMQRLMGKTQDQRIKEQAKV
jgi:hypothetical protein